MRISAEARLVLLAGVASGALMSGQAAAQQAADSDRAIRLEQIVVEQDETGEATGPVEGYVAKRTATGSKTATPVEEIPQAVSVIGRTEMDDQGAQKVDEALRYTSGVFTQPFGPDSDTNWMFIRGFQATQTGVFQDGLPLYSYGFGGFFVDSFNLERIEVLKGASSVLYGGGNPGGLVNYVSKRPTGERLRYVETGIDDAGTAYLGFDIGDAINEAIAYRVSGRIAGGSGYTDFNDGWRGSISPSFHWALNDATSLTILSSVTAIDERHNGGGFLPYVGTVVDASFGRIDPDANFTEPDIDTYLRKQASIGYEFEHVLENEWAVRQNLRFGWADIHEISLYPYGYLGFSPVPTDPDNLLTRINFEHETSVATLLVDNQIEGAVNTGAIEHRLLFGLDYKLFSMDQVQSSGSATPISATDPVYGTPQGARSPYIDQTLTQHQLGAYVQDQMRFGGFIATLGGRYDFVSQEAVGTPAYQGDKGEFSGRAGIAYEFANGLIPYASTSTFFNPVFGTSPLVGVYEPETGHQVEVGLKYVPTFMDALVTAALFDLTRQNVVTGPFLAETQLGEVNSQGIEIEAKANIDEHWRVSAAFTALDLEITKDADASLVGKTPYLVPETQASLWLDYTFAGTGAMVDGVSVGGGVRYIGASWADNANTLKVPDVTLLDARVGYARDNWGVDLNVTNLLDEVYVASCQTEFSCGYGEGRSVKLRFHATF